MKKLYKFQMTQEIEGEEVVVSKDDDGNEVRTTKPTKTNRERNFFIRKPTRKMYDEAELYYGVKLSEGIKAGMMTRALLAKRFDNDGGVLSDEDKTRYSALYFTLFELQNEYQRISLIDKAKRTDVEEEKYKEVIKALIETRERIQDFETAQASIFDQTAENRARNKTIMWWTLMLAYEGVLAKEDRIEDFPFFGAGDIESKLDKYDDIEENEDRDEFLAEAMRKFAYFVSFWYVGKAATEEEFEQLAAMADADVESAEKEQDEINEVIENIIEDEKKAEGTETGKTKANMTEAEKIDKEAEEVLGQITEISEEPKAEEPKAEEPKAEEPKAEEPKVEEPKLPEEPKQKQKKKKNHSKNTKEEGTPEEGGK